MRGILSISIFQIEYQQLSQNLYGILNNYIKLVPPLI